MKRARRPYAANCRCVCNPDRHFELTLAVEAQPGAASGEPNIAKVYEGGSETPSDTATSSDTLSDGVPPFGASSFTATAIGLDGKPDNQAGGHPNEYTTRFDLNSTIRLGPETQLPEALSVEDLRDAVIDLPIGFFGTATATPQCKFSQLNATISVKSGGCPLDTQVGHIISEPRGFASIDSGIYNMVPEYGVAAEFGFTDILGNSHVIYANVRPTPDGYVLRATSREITQVALADVIATFYGDPAEKDAELRQQQEEAELHEQGVEEAFVERERNATRVAMFTNPSDCTGAPLTTTAHLDSWQHPGATLAPGIPNTTGPGWVESSYEAPAVTGCDLLRFTPEAFTVKPETTTADSPTGLNVDLKIPQDENPATLATPPLRDASVTLPAGLTVNPAAAGGLAACTEAQIGWLGRVSAENAGLTNFTPSAPACPEASKVGTVEITTPLIASILHGSVYLATQDENPYGSLLAAYIVIDDAATGTILKIPGELKTDPNTGQITGTFNDNPQFPFSELHIHFDGGPRGDLATPETCATYTTTSDLEPWSGPDSGRRDPVGYVPDQQRVRNRLRTAVHRGDHQPAGRCLLAVHAVHLKERLRTRVRRAHRLAATGPRRQDRRRHTMLRRAALGRRGTQQPR